MIRTTLVALVRHFALELDSLKTNPAMSMLTTNCSHKLVENPGTTRGTKLSILHTIFLLFFGQPWFLTAGPLISISRGLRKACLATEQQAFLRVIAQLRTDLERERTLVLPRGVCTSPLAVNTTVGVLASVKVSSSSELEFFFAQHVH